jgi:hypothetical protein
MANVCLSVPQIRKRSKMLTKAVIARTIIISILISTVYLQVDDREKQRES